MPHSNNRPRPTLPMPPDPGECCNSGCERCVFSVYEDALEAYREALLEWQRNRVDDEE